MKQDELNKKLELHKKWLKGEEGGLRLNLQGTNLRLVDLRGVDIDFSCLPLWCGGLDFKIDEKQAKQLMYHVINLMQYSNIDIPKSHKLLFKWLEDSHLVTKHNLPILKEASDE